MKEIIKLENIKRDFKVGDETVHALRGVSFTIYEGEFVTIMGTSGSGKSTLLNTLGCLDTPTSGEYYLDGTSVRTMGKNARATLRNRKIGFVFQNYNLLPKTTAVENVELPLMYNSSYSAAERHKKAVESLVAVGLGDRLMHKSNQMSGGQKQRVAIARALATDPKVLLCDEATSALDPTTTASILRLLKDLNQKLGVTVVVITHQMSVIEEICSQVAILDGGVVAEQGKVEDIFSHPSTDAARRLVYPGGASVSQYPMGTHAVRVAFNGGTAYQPLIASLAIDCGVKVNILGADTRNIDGKAFGTMLLGLPDDPNEAAKALSYIRAQPNVTAEEVEYHA